jgi:TrmH family RNA methyltransferase
MDSASKCVSFILVRPEFLGNIGSVARAMKNFGLSDLRFVDAPKGFKDSESRKMAVGAFDILKRAKVFETLADAVADLNYVVATSSGKQRNQTFVSPNQVAERLSATDTHLKCGIVFGGERNGLTNDEIAYCHSVLRIETDPSFSVLNLAQAACITAYALSTSHPPASKSTSPIDPPPTMQELDNLFLEMNELLRKTGFARERNEKQVLAELQNLLQRALPTRREFALLKGAMKSVGKGLK